MRASRPQGSDRGVLVVHPGAELYGADRVLLESATALATRFDVTIKDGKIADYRVRLDISFKYEAAD